MTVSREKVEKVVSPPQKPIVRKILIWELLKEAKSKRKTIIPIRKLPKTLTVRVPYGKVGERKRKTILERKYLETPPRAEPKNIRR